MWFKLIALLSVIALASAVPKCPGLGEYTMQEDVKDDLVLKVLLNSPESDVTNIYSVYDCGLEKMAGEILKDPYKPISFLKDIGIFPLVYAIKDEPKTTLRLFTHAAIDDWKKHIKNLHYYTVGCNYRKEHEFHNYLCLFRYEAE